MTIEGFTYVRNGLKMGYPFVSSIQSILPIVDRLIVVLGDSTDGSREAIQKIGSAKIEIVDSVWDEEQRKNGSIFREQATIGLEKMTGDWSIHIQADEVLHEDSYDEILRQIKLADESDDVDGLLFPFYHFWGDYNYIRNTRRTHANEIRAFKNKRKVFSYKDSQGFRIADGSEKGAKLKVLKTTVPIYHYSYTRNPSLMKKKSNYFHRFWHNEKWIKENTNETDFDFNDVDKLEVFSGEHPSYMTEVMKQQDWKFEYDPSKSTMSAKDKLLYAIEKVFNYRLFEYKNYIVKR